MSDINKIFGLLDEWRDFPNYQLERRADIYFALYLPQILMAHFKDELGEENITHANIIPEFPLRKGKNEDEESTSESSSKQNNKKSIRSKDNLSNKVDYAVFCRNTIYLVELKIDMGSLNDVQDKYLQKAQRKIAPELIYDIARLRSASASKEKYDRLLNHICEKILRDFYGVNLKHIDLVESLYIAPWSKAINAKKKVEERLPTLDKLDRVIVYIQPREKNRKGESDLIVDRKCTITFNDIVGYLKKIEERSYLNMRFCESLERWEKEPHFQE